MVTPLWFQASSPVCINVLFVLHFVIFSTKKRLLRQRRNTQSKENLKDITDSSFCLCFFMSVQTNYPMDSTMHICSLGPRPKTNPSTDRFQYCAQDEVWGRD